MSELQRQTDAQAEQLNKELDLLDLMLDNEVTSETVNLVLSQAKRGERECRLLVRCLAKMRDNLQA
jgi:hypothetical protein